MELPAGMMPNDSNIEIFAHPTEFGKCLFTKNGQTHQFCEMPIRITPILYKECLNDKRAIKGLKAMGIKEVSWVEQYNYCNRGRLDGVVDITPSGKTSIEYFNCGRRGQCPGEGFCCKPLEINGEKITARERECLSLIAEGKTDNQIREEMGFTSNASVNSLMERLRNKTNVNRRSEMAIIANRIGI